MSTPSGLRSEPVIPSGRKGHRACFNCKNRKARCVFDSPGLTSCHRCVDLGLICRVRTVERRGGNRNVALGRARRNRQLQLAVKPDSIFTPKDALTTSDWTVHREADYPHDDALMMLADATDEIVRKNGLISPRVKHSSLLRVEGNTPSDHKDASSAPQPDLLVSETPLVSQGILSEHEVFEYVSAFFSEIFAFYACINFPEDYSKVSCLVGQPALLAVICTLGARVKEGPQHRELHERLWAHTEQTISNLMWRCPNSQVQSMVHAIVILSEWLPGIMLFSGSSATGDKYADDQNIGGGGVLESHARFCWPLLGQAARLAQYTQFLEHDIGTFITLQFADQLLACRLGLHPTFDQLAALESEDAFTPEALRSLKGSLAMRARLDEVKLLHLANKSLYGSRMSAHQLVQSGQHLHILGMLYRIMENWKVLYNEICRSSEWEHRVIMFEFSHCQLYIFSLCLMPWQHRNLSTQRLTSINESKRFLEAATEAAIYIVDHEASSDLNLNKRHAPIEWVCRLLHASVFLAKLLLVGAVSVTKFAPGDVIGVLRTATDMLESFPPASNREYCRHLRTVCIQMEAIYKVNISECSIGCSESESQQDLQPDLGEGGEQMAGESDDSTSNIESALPSLDPSLDPLPKQDNQDDVDWQLLWNADILSGIQGSLPQSLQFDFYT